MAATITTLLFLNIGVFINKLYQFLSTHTYHQLKVSKILVFRYKSDYPSLEYNDLLYILQQYPYNYPWNEENKWNSCKEKNQSTERLGTTS